MPTRPPAHVIGDMATQQVANIWLSTGAAVEQVFKDYGEDLCVQPALRGEMDDCRIWIQVKGSVDADENHWRPSRSTFLVGIRNDQLSRWSRFADEVVLVLWDVTLNQGWYALPSMQVDELNLLTYPKRKSQIQLLKQDIFDASVAMRLADRARMRSAVRQFQVLESKIAHAREFDGSDMERLNRVRFTLIAKWLLDHEIMERRGDEGLVKWTKKFGIALAEQFRKHDAYSTQDFFDPVFAAVTDVIAPTEIHEGLLASVVEHIDCILRGNPRYFIDPQGELIPNFDFSPPSVPRDSS